MKILLVEDSKMAIFTLTHIINRAFDKLQCDIAEEKRMKPRITILKNSELAADVFIREFKEDPYNIVLMDTHLIDEKEVITNGIESTKKIDAFLKAQDHAIASNIRIYSISADYNAFETQSKGITSFTGYLGKMPKLDTMVDVIMDAVGPYHDICTILASATHTAQGLSIQDAKSSSITSSAAAPSHSESQTTPLHINTEATSASAGSAAAVATATEKSIPNVSATIPFFAAPAPTHQGTGQFTLDAKSSSSKLNEATNTIAKATMK